MLYNYTNVKRNKIITQHFDRFSTLDFFFSLKFGTLLWINLLQIVTGRCRNTLSVGTGLYNAAFGVAVVFWSVCWKEKSP